MNRQSLLRRALWAAAFFNVGGAYLFGFPASPLGTFIGLPQEVPAVYRAFTAMFVLLFGGAYAWLAHHRPIIRPFVAFGAIGKASAFALTVGLALVDKTSGATVALLSGDLVLAALFAWCLAGPQPGAAVDGPAPLGRR